MEEPQTTKRFQDFDKRLPYFTSKKAVSIQGCLTQLTNTSQLPPGAIKANKVPALG